MGVNRLARTKALSIKVTVSDKVENPAEATWSFKVLYGNTDGDGKVNIFDLVIVARAFGSTPTSSNWDARADMNGDGKVNIFDLVIVAKNFGKSS